MTPEAKIALCSVILIISAIGFSMVFIKDRNKRFVTGLFMASVWLASMVLVSTNIEKRDQLIVKCVESGVEYWKCEAVMRGYPVITTSSQPAPSTQYYFRQTPKEHSI